MEVKKYNPIVVKPKAKGASLVVPQPHSKPKPKLKTKLEAKSLWHSMDRVLSLENKKKLDSIYAKSFVNTGRK